MNRRLFVVAALPSMDRRLHKLVKGKQPIFITAQRALCQPSFSQVLAQEGQRHQEQDDANWDENRHLQVSLMGGLVIDESGTGALNNTTAARVVIRYIIAGAT